VFWAVGGPIGVPARAEDPTAILQMGYQALKQEKYDLAISDATRALAIDPNQPVGYLLRAYAYTAAGREAEAIADHRRGLKLDPNNKIVKDCITELSNGWPLVICGELIRPMIEADLLLPADPELDELLWLPPMPGAQPGLRPVGRMNFNVLRHVVFDRQSGALTLIGDLDPRWPTGPIPYLEFLQAAWNSPTPGFSLEPGSGETQRVGQLLQAAMKDLQWVTKLVRRAAQNRQSPGLEALVQSSFRLTDGELAGLRSQVAAGSTEATRTAAIAELIRRFHAILRTEGMVVPPQVLDQYAGFNSFNELRYTKMAADTQLARVLFESDYGLKFVINSPLLARHIKGFETRVDFLRRRDPAEFKKAEPIRYWFRLNQAGVRLAENQKRVTVSFDTPKIVIDAVRSGRNETRTPALTEYAQKLTNQFDQIAEHLPAWHELREAVKVMTLAKMLKRQLVTLQFPQKTWNPWVAPRRVPAVVSAALFENPGGINLSSYVTVLSVSGGVELGNAGDRILLAGMGDEQIKGIGSYFDDGTNASLPPLTPLILGDASVVDLRPDTLGRAAESVTVPLVSTGNRVYQVPPLTPPQPVGMVSPLELKLQTHRLTTAQLRAQMAELERQLRALNQTVLSNQADLNEWVGQVQQAQIEAFFRIPDAMLASLKYLTIRKLQLDRRQLDALGNQFRATADPAQRRKLWNQIKPLTNEMRALHWQDKAIEGGEKINTVMAWLEQLGVQLKEVREKGTPKIGSDELEFATRQVVEQLASFRDVKQALPMLGVEVALTEIYIDTAYDLARELVAWKRVDQMDHSLPQYTFAVSELQRRLVAIVDELHARSASSSALIEGKPVLGDFPAYVADADELDARRVKVPESEWKKLSDEGRWLAKQKVLDKAIGLGQDFRLATPAQEMRSDGDFRKELDYLVRQGYRPSVDGLQLVPYPKQSEPTPIRISTLSSGDGVTVDDQPFPRTTNAKGLCSISFLQRDNGAIPIFGGEWRANKEDDVTPEVALNESQVWVFESDTLGKAKAIITGSEAGAVGEATGWSVMAYGREIKIKFDVHFAGTKVRLLNFREDVPP
jgi:tetratricopeptide (TPR) repeat protein